MSRPVARLLGLSVVLQLGCAPSGPAAPEPPASAISVTLRVEGGFAGRLQRLEVGPDGSLTLFNRDVVTGTGQLEAETLQRLHSIVDSPAFRALAPRYMPENTCCDRFSYLVRVERGDGEQSVSTLDGAAWPPALGEALALLNEARRHVTSPLQ